MYECEILADSVGPTGKRLTTLVVTYPRMVHAEVLTHRMFSRNSASSRAIPNEKLRERVINDPAMPVWWGKNQAGMQAREELSDADVMVDIGLVDVEGQPVLAKQSSPKSSAARLWIKARDQMLAMSSELADVGLHKQLCNRLIEPWMGITVIISATEWDNAFRLRRHADAQPECRRAFDAMYDAMEASKPTELNETQWHLPLVKLDDWNHFPESQLVLLSVARCARVSYLTHDGKRDPEADFGLYDKLSGSGHWSPFEHVAQPLLTSERVGNFIGWRQHRADVDPNFIR